jgi:hypothetical protein
MVLYIAAPIGTFTVALLLCVLGTLRDTGGVFPGASTLAGDFALAYLAASLSAIAVFMSDRRVDRRKAH